MTLPSVAIVGRPNVGKSSLFNFLASRRIAIVAPIAGVTRDRIAAAIEHEGRWFELIDTGGYGVRDSGNLTAEIQLQIRRALDMAQLVLFVVDARTGPVPPDQSVATLLREFGKPVILVANKVDSSALKSRCADLFALGWGEPLAISCREHRGRTDLLAAILARLGAAAAAALPEPELKLAVVGKRNVGKSELINALAGQPRVIVSEIPGATRDSIDVRLEFDGHDILIIDTAGVRKRSRMTGDDLEFYSLHRAERSIRRADLVILMIDATLEVGDVNQKLAGYVLAQFKPVIVAINKWDLVGSRADPSEYAEYVARRFPQLAFAPVACLSAKTRDNLDGTMRLALALHRQASTRLTTGQLNQAVEDILSMRGPGGAGAKPVKVYYATQIGVRPPTIVLFVNHPPSVTEEYRRYFLRQLRQRTALSEVPIRLLLRGHRDRNRRLSSAGVQNQ